MGPSTISFWQADRNWYIQQADLDIVRQPARGLACSADQTRARALRASPIRWYRPPSSNRSRVQQSMRSN